MLETSKTTFYPKMVMKMPMRGWRFNVEIEPGSVTFCKDRGILSQAHLRHLLLRLGLFSLNSQAAFLLHHSTSIELINLADRQDTNVLSTRDDSPGRRSCVLERRERTCWTKDDLTTNSSITAAFPARRQHSSNTEGGTSGHSVSC